MSQLYASLLYIGSSTTGGGTMETAQGNSTLYIIIGVISGFAAVVLIVLSLIVIWIVYNGRYELHYYNF